MSLLEIKDLYVEYRTEEATVKAVNGVTFEIEEGQSLGLVGETGAGKTTTALSILRLIPDPPGVICGGSIVFNGTDILALEEKQVRKIRGNDISMIFQDPMTALNPVIQVGDQIAEVIFQHQDVSRAEAKNRTMEMLRKVGIEPRRYSDYPHEFSGGMKQRIVIAIALACNPKLLLADEPTTALDVTIQAQVLKLIRELQQEFKTSMLLITHDLGVVAQTCDKVAIMYAGEVVEYGSAEDVFDRTSHPYTKGLFNSIPSLEVETERLKPIPGLVPSPANLPTGCYFHPRCDVACGKCAEVKPESVEITPGHFVKCHRCAKGGA